MIKMSYLLIYAAILFSPQVIASDVYIYLVRHGQTFFNVTGQVQGWE